jgi:hypothetical protein
MLALRFQINENDSSKGQCAFVDTNGRFDLLAAEGIDLSRVLWVRCVERRKKLNVVEQAFKATDILIHNGELKLIIVDLSGVAERQIRKIPLTTWHRFSRAAEKASITLIFLTSVPAAQSCTNLKLHISQRSGIWTNLQQLSQPEQSAILPHGRIISAIEMKCEIMREKLRKSIQSSNRNLSQLSKRA